MHGPLREYAWLRTRGGTNYPTFWLNRSHQPTEELGVRADAGGAGMEDLVKFVLSA